MGGFGAGNSVKCLVVRPELPRWDRHLGVADPAEVCGTCWRFTEPPTTWDRAAIHSNLNWTILSVTWSARREWFLAEMDSVTLGAAMRHCWSRRTHNVQPSVTTGRSQRVGRAAETPSGINVGAVALANKNAQCVGFVHKRRLRPLDPPWGTRADLPRLATISNSRESFSQSERFYQENRLSSYAEALQDFTEAKCSGRRFIPH